MLKLLFVLLLESIICTNGQANGSFWWLNYLETTTPDPITTTASNERSFTKYPKDGDDYICCECVPFYQCLNGSIVTSGEGLLDLRKQSVYNVHPEKCPGDYDICCSIPDPHPSCNGIDVETTTEATPRPDVLPADTPCYCLSYEKCPKQLIVSDFKGRTAIEVEGYPPISHSKCNKAIEACCAIHLPVPGEVTTENPHGEDCNCVRRSLCDEDGFIIMDGGALINPRFGPVSPPNDCSSNPNYICCKERPDTTLTPASTPNKEEQCDCVHPILCSEDGEIITDGSYLINVRNSFKRTSSALVCELPSVKCCIKDEETVTDPLDISSTPTPLDITTPTIPTPKKECGVRNSNGLKFRIAGFKEGEGQFGEFPWVAMLLRKEFLTPNDKYRLLFHGGGTLIHPRVILTAAHKVYENLTYIVRLGEWDATDNQEPKDHQDIEVAKVIVHPNFHPRNLQFNYALLVLKEEAAINDHINPICLVKDLSEVIHEKCVINGWGQDAFEGDFQRIMKSVSVPLEEHDICQALLRRTRLGRWFRLHPSFVCAGGEQGKDTCQGDGGGPLACPLKSNPERYNLVGITSWGIGCGEKDVPGVYTNTLFKQDWINEQIQRETNTNYGHED